MLGQHCINFRDIRKNQLFFRDKPIKKICMSKIMKLNERQFHIIRNIFEGILKKEGYSDFLEICGDETEDFCKELLKKLDKFYANI